MRPLTPGTCSQVRGVTPGVKSSRSTGDASVSASVPLPGGEARSLGVAARACSACSVDRDVCSTVGAERIATPIGKPLDETKSRDAGHEIQLARRDEP
jgi:hypothetical protein